MSHSKGGKRGPGRPRKEKPLEFQERFRSRRPVRNDPYTRETSWDTQYMDSILPDPDVILEKLGLSADEAYRNIEADGHLTSVKDSLLSSVKKLEWDVVTDKGSERAAREIKAILEDFDMNQFYSDVFRAKGWGMSPIGVTWDSNGSIIFPNKLEAKPVRYFEYNNANELRFLSKGHMGIGEPIKPMTLLVARNEPDFDNPYGVKLLSKSYWYVTFKRNSLKWWNKFIEKYAIPWLLVKVPPNTSTTVIDEALENLGNLLQDGIGSVPDNNSVEALDLKDKGVSAELFEKFNYTMNSELSKTWIGGTLTTEVGDKGTYAASKTHMEVKDDRRDDLRDLIVETMNELVTWINQLNFGGLPPKFKMFQKTSVTKEEAEIDGILAEKMGFRPSKEYFVNKYGKDPAEFELEMVSTPGAVPPEIGPDAFTAEFAAKISQFKDQAALDRAMRDLPADKLQAQIEGPLNPIIRMLRKAENYEQALGNLVEMFTDMSMSEAEKNINRAIFAAEAWGRIVNTET